MEAKGTIITTPPTAAKLSPVGSHQFIDEFNLAYHRAVAEALLRDPEAVVSRARRNIARWLEGDVYDDGEKGALSEWDKILAESSVEELIAVITEDSDEGQRLRQSTPFTGVLPAERRREILTDCAKRAVA